jgi:tetratricopeptide (TPR) repeat protein
LLQWTLSLLILLSLNLSALEIAINSGVEDFKKYSILHLRDKEKFTCEAIKNDYEITTKIVCAFSKKPPKLLKELQNNFFKIDTLIQNKTFFVVITPFHKIELVPMAFNLTVDDSVYEPDVKLSEHWMVIGYKDKLPLLHKDKKSDEGINFPFFMDEDKLPFVGGLDLKGNPIYIKKIEDVKDYLKVKKYFKEKKYEQCLSVIDTILEDFPHTLFKAELIYYKIKVYKELKDNDNVIDYSKLFLREYSSDENVAEVLSLIAQAYSLIGQNGDADYFFDRLFSEHEGTKFAQWGYIYKGHQLEESGGVSVAIKFYKRALNETTDIDVAVNAAYNLASVYMGSSMKESKKYMEKILKAKPTFLVKDMKKSLDMMESYADTQHYKIAAQMAQAILDAGPKDMDNKEELLKNRALWLAKTPDKQAALQALNEYLKLYEDGLYANEVQVVKDSLFFDAKDINASEKFKEYDKLIEEYANDSIGQRALYEKAKLLLEQKNYLKVLEMKTELEDLDEEKYKDIPQMIEQAAIGAMEDSLAKKACKEVLIIANDYNISLSNSWDDGIYECAMKGGDYELSKSIASKNFQSKNLEHRKKWLYRYIKVDFVTGNYSDVIGASKDLIVLIEDDKNSEYKEVYRYLFDTYQRLEKSDEMLELIDDIQKVFGLSYKDLDRYVAMVSLGSQRDDDAMVIKYGKEALKIQEKSDSHAQSPFLEFALYQAYSNIEDYNNALDVIRILDKVELNKKDRARQKYLLGTVLAKLWRDEEAVKAFEEAIKADPESPWASLAKTAKDI